MPRVAFPTGVCLAISGWLTAGYGHATVLDQVVISATRSERTVIDAPVRVEVVNTEELSTRHAPSLKEALDGVPGLQLREIHGKSGYEASLQGLSGDQVLVLVDGMPVSASTGSVVDVTQLGLADAQRVEIVKGATSAQYGSAAMGGVINVITRPIAQGWAASASGDIGSYGEQNPSGKSAEATRGHGQLQVEGGSAHWRGKVVLDQLDSQGFSPTPEAWSRPGDALTRSHAQGRLEWHGLEDFRAFAGVSQFDENINNRYVLALPGGGSAQQKSENTRRIRWVGGAEQTLENHAAWRLSMLHERFDNNTEKTAGETLFDVRQANIELDQLSAQFEFPPTMTQAWMVGLDWRRDGLAQEKDGVSEINAPDDVSRQSRELFVQNSAYIGASLEALTGVRYQQDSDFGGHAVAKTAFRWHALQGNDWRATVRIGFGQGYRVPNLKERYYLFDHSQLGYVVIGNPDLVPEESVSGQLGMILHHRDNLMIDVGIFSNRLRNLIQVDQENPTVGDAGVSEFRYDNIGRAITQGVEVGSIFSPGTAWRFDAGYTFLETENRDTGEELTRRPNHQLQLGIRRHFSQGAALALRGRYQSSELVSTANNSRSPSWALFDIRLSQSLTEALTLYSGVDNVFGEQRDFSDPDDFGPLAGTFFYLGFNYAIQGKK